MTKFQDGKLNPGSRREAAICACAQDRREGLDKIVSRLSEQHPTWSVQHLKARAKIEWAKGARE